ncbi:b197b9cd-a334-45db-b0c3-e1fda643d47c [Thermothielavioides terrestris]|uniref:B197b9cd-a334-45db-b0c3-e1fda643d47c n=1 Tax=Thermothielavioides terrestris TaxID=2587410 RepID=A0A3S4ASX1_9PEZI|nr:b197b9cd-a334-45db-b0c3-e1fda643d47c [Thermothielavioides terrestris]
MSMMDYHAIHGHDVSSFDLPSTHRLPTVSAAQALEDLEGDDSNFISTGLAALDASLRSGLDGSGPAGIRKGHVTEVWGPPGAGKTALGLLPVASLSAAELYGFHRMPIERLRAVAGKEAAQAEDADSGCLDAFTHYTCPSLPHLIALLCRPTVSCIPPGTSLVVVDSLSALVNHSFPKHPETRTATDSKGSKGPSASARRLQVLQYIAGSLQKLAATRDLAVVVLTQCATKMQAERGATLIPAINASVWDQGMSTRLVLFRDWLQERSGVRGVHFVGIQKSDGKDTASLIDSIGAFTVEKTGLVAVDYDNTRPSRTLTSTPAQKRKLGDTDFEIADSDDEDYGWDDDEDLPPMPSQWQGSEDLLLVRPLESEDEQQQDEDEEPLDTGTEEDRCPSDVAEHADTEPNGPDRAG